jgi:hypothetical protein
MIHQGSSGFRGNVPDIEVAARETLSLTKTLTEILALHCGQPFERVKRDTERDYYMSVEEAKAYGADRRGPRALEALRARRRLGRRQRQQQRQEAVGRASPGRLRPAERPTTQTRRPQDETRRPAPRGAGATHRPARAAAGGELR